MDFSLKINSSPLANGGQGFRQSTVNGIASVGDGWPARFLFVVSMHMSEAVTADDKTGDSVSLLLKITANVDLLRVVSLTTYQHASPPWQCRVNAEC